MAEEPELGYPPTRNAASGPVQEGVATAVPPNDPMERDRAIAVFLRQLSSGLSAYRLFPGDLGQPIFSQAAERIQEAAERVLQWGTLEVEIAGGRFLTVHGPVPGDDRIERLALACYQHRAERLIVKGVPEPRELGALYEALSRPFAQIVAGGGMGSSLRVAGVRAIVVSEVAPQAPDPEELGARPTAEQREMWERLGDPDTFARDLVAGERAGAPPAEVAQSLYRRLQHIVSLLPEAQIQGFELYRRLHEINARLPSLVRGALGGVLLGRVRLDLLAGRLIGTMTDAELARMLADQSVAAGRDPVGLARDLVKEGIRQEDLVDLTIALLAGQEEGGTIIAGLDRVGIAVDEGPPQAASPGSPVVRTVSSLLARGLVSMGQDDVRAIREQWPQSDVDQRGIAMAALHDYLRIETDTDRIGEVLGMWVEETTAALKGRNEEGVVALARAVEGGRDPSASGDKRALVDVSTRRVLHGGMLRELVSQPADGSDSESEVRLLRSFGAVGVDCLMDELAVELDRGRRALLLNVLCQLGQGHQELVARRLLDHRWYVARNAVTILYRVGGPEAIPPLIEATRHREAAVRREAVRGLIAVAGVGAMSDLIPATQDPDATVRAALVSGLGALVDPQACAALATLAVSFRDQADRRRAIDALARHPAREALAQLDALSSGRHQPSLPRKLRRYARVALEKRPRLPA